MAIFDQRGQHVTYQYNAAGNINFGLVHNRAELVGQLEALVAEVQRARQAGAMDEESATDAEYQLTKAVQQARKPEPDKYRLLDPINPAKGIIEGVTSAGTATTGLVNALARAAELAGRFFS